MGDQPYELMTARQAADALDAYLAERAPALHRLRTALAGQGRDPDRMLEGSVYSVSPLWSWITARAGRLGVDPHSLTADPSRASWPSWARHGRLVDPHPPDETIVLVDGFASLGQVLLDAAPQAMWQVGEHILADHLLLNYSVLASDHHQFFLPALLLYSVYEPAHGRDPMSGTEMLAHTGRTIDALHGQDPEAAALEEPLVTVVAELDCFDVGLREDIPAKHPGVVEHLIAELDDRDGVGSVHRYGPAALVVDVAERDELRVKMWCTLWLQRHLPR